MPDKKKLSFLSSKTSTLDEQTLQVKAKAIVPDQVAYTASSYVYLYKDYKSYQQQIRILQSIFGIGFLRGGWLGDDNSPAYALPYRLLVTPKQHKLLKEANGSEDDYLIKSLRWDEKYFYEDFILGITPSRVYRHNQNLRQGDHKAYTVFPYGIYKYAKKPTSYPPDKHHKKFKQSKHQSTTLVNKQIQPPVFGHQSKRKDKLVGVVVRANNAGIRACMINDFGTVSRPHEKNTKEDARRYYDGYDLKMFSDLEAFKQGLQADPAHSHNEVLARIRWNINSSAVCIFSDNFESRCLAQYLAERLHHRIKAQFEENGLRLDSAYHIPITYYIPGSEKHSVTLLPEEQAADKERAQEIFKNKKDRNQIIKEGNGEFLLILNDPVKVWKELINDPAHPLLRMTISGDSQLVEALHIRAMKAGLDSTLFQEFRQYEDQHPEVFDSFIIENMLRRAIKSNIPQAVTIWLALSRYHSKDITKRWLISLAVDQNTHIKITHEILQHFSPVNIKLPAQILQQAATHGYWYMIDKWSDLYTPHDKEYITKLLHIAAKKGQIEVVKGLIQKYEIINEKYSKEDTALHIAIRAGHLTVVNELIQQGADINLTNAAGDTPLHVAVQIGHKDLIRKLLTCPHINVNQFNKTGKTPLHLASLKTDHKLARILLSDSKCNPNVTDYYGNTPLVYALHYGNSDTAKAFFETRDTIDVNKPNKSGWTPFHMAATTDQVELVKLMISHGAQINQTDFHGFTPLHYACRFGQLNNVKLLIEKQADVNLAGHDSETPLYAAAQAGYVDLVYELLKQGADANKSKHLGLSANAPAFYTMARTKKTPLQAAAEHKDVVCLLKQYAKNPENINDPFKLIQAALLDYALPAKTRTTSSLYRFFHGQWQHHHASIVADLLLDAKYTKDFNETLLRSFIKELDSKIPLSEINPEGDLAAILKLTNSITQIDVADILEEEQEDRNLPDDESISSDNSSKGSKH